jgi:hypothetical protein
MRLRTLMVLVLVHLCLGMADRAPAGGGRPSPDRARPAPPKVYPVALRYRQQLDQQLLLLSAPQSPAPAPAVRAAGGPPGWLVERASPLPSGAALLSLLVRLQP